LTHQIRADTTQRQNWLAQFPSAAAELWPWCLAQKQDRLLELLAFRAAAIVDGVVLPHKDSSDAAKVEHANQLAAALQMDMRDWFTPTVENFFGRVSKLQIANALTEAGNPLQPQDSKTKKGELAAIAAKKINGTGWLPEPLRISSSDSAGEANA
jgi:ParB family chromosome partitioning protein